MLGQDIQFYHTIDLEILIDVMVVAENVKSNEVGRLPILNRPLSDDGRLSPEVMVVYVSRLDSARRDSDNSLHKKK